MAWETPNRVVALAIVEVDYLGNVTIAQTSGVRELVRTGIGAYTVTLEQPAAPSSTVVMCSPMAGSVADISGAAQVDGTVRVSSYAPGGFPALVDCPVWALLVLQAPADDSPGDALPDVQPPSIPTGILEHVYVSTANGDDTNTGDSPAAPMATMQAFIDRHPAPPLGGYCFHLDTGTHDNWSFPRGWGTYEPVIVIGDGAGQPGDDGFVELQASEASQGGSTTTVIVTSGGAVAAWLGKTLEVTSGAAAGARRSINRVSGANLHVPRQLTGFVAGDSYRVIEPGAYVAENATPEIPICVAMGTPPAENQAGSHLGSLSGAYVPINLSYLNPTGQYNRHQQSVIFAWGIDTDAPGIGSFNVPSSWAGFGFESSGVADRQTLEQLAAFIAQIDPTAPQSEPELAELWGGWCVRLDSTQALEAAFVAGYIVGVSGGITLSGSSLLGGGGSMILTVFRGTNQIRCPSATANSWWQTAQLVVGSATGPSTAFLLISAFGTVSVRNAATPAVSVQKEAVLSLVQNNAALAELVSSTGIGVRAQDGGRVMLKDFAGGPWVINGSTPGTNDLQVDGAAAVGLATIAAPGASQVNGATVIQRAI